MATKQETTEQREDFIQIGFTALRDPVTRNFLPAVPLYIKADDTAIISEQKMIENFAELMALRMKTYLDGCEKAGVGLP